jgi:MFS family permease
VSGPSVLVAAVRNRAVLRAEIAFFAFNTAEWATWVAILVFAFDRGGPTATGIVAFGLIVPCMIVAPFGAVVGDRMRRERALALGYAVQAAGMGLTAVAFAAGAGPVIVYGCAAVAAAAMTLSRPVHHAILPSLAHTPEELTASNSVSSTVEGLAILSGPLLAGILLDVAGVGTVFGVMSVAVGLGSLLVVGLPAQPVPGGASDHEAVLRAALTGLREVQRERGAGSLLFVVGAQWVVAGMLDVLAVSLAFDVLGMGPSGPGVITSAMGVGSLLGAAATVSLIGRRSLMPAVVLGAFLSGVPLSAVALAAVPAAAVTLLATSGVGKSFVDVAARTLLQRTVKDEALARVFGLQEFLMMVGLAAGSILAPVLIAVFGARGAYVAAGAFLPAFVLINWFGLRTLDARASVPEIELALLRSISLFRPLAAPVVERLARNLQRVTVPAGTVVIREGEPGDRFYVVAEGDASVSTRGRELARLGRGGYFGEIALLRDVPRTATVVALGDLVLFSLEREEFLAAITGSRSATEAADRSVDLRLAEHRPEEP